MGGWAAVATSSSRPWGCSPLLNVPPQAKKPLVFTHRVMRLFGTLALLFAIAAAAAWLLPLWAAPAVYRAFFLPGFLVGGAGQPDQRSPWSGRWPTGMSGMPAAAWKSPPRLTVIGITRQLWEDQRQELPSRPAVRQIQCADDPGEL